jgi:hypothetical protein
VAEHGLTSLTTIDIGTGQRAQLVRKVPKPICKPAEMEAFWNDGDKVTDKCRAQLAKTHEPFIGAPLISGAKSTIALLHGDRTGELAVLDPKTLVEKRAIKMPWCN